MKEFKVQIVISNVRECGRRNVSYGMRMEIGREKKKGKLDQRGREREKKKEERGREKKKEERGREKKKEERGREKERRSH